MTIEQAVAILNERRHNGERGWLILRYPDGDPFRITYEWANNSLTPFEAVAVAEKYLRDGEGRAGD